LSTGRTLQASRYRSPSTALNLALGKPSKVINKAKEEWIAAKARCKLPKKVVPVLVSDRGVKTDIF